uniref:Uncharacterized protein n=1 Tax=Arcella intermedia TaxID=1963864 RepID=A0A6B2LUH6_9EUKA
MSFRPLVLPDCTRLKIRVPMDSRAKVKASFDGRKPTDLEPGCYVVVTVSPWPMPTFSMRTPIVEWFRSIESRLHWNVREIQHPLREDNLKSHKNSKI